MVTKSHKIGKASPPPPLRMLSLNEVKEIYTTCSYISPIFVQTKVNVFGTQGSMGLTSPTFAEPMTHFTPTDFIWRIEIPKYIARESHYRWLNTGLQILSLAECYNVTTSIHRSFEGISLPSSLRSFSPNLGCFLLPCRDIFKLWSTYLLKIIQSLPADPHTSAASSRLKWTSSRPSLTPI